VVRRPSASSACMACLPLSAGRRAPRHRHRRGRRRSWERWANAAGSPASGLERPKFAA
jgi:hypothetical protein